MQRDMRRRYPHMEWDGAAFTPQKPAPSPVLHVNISIMHSAHKKLGVNWSGSRKGTYQSQGVDAIADTGCQTSTAGIEFLESIGCPESYLVPTRHQIIGINTESLGIIGSILLRIECGGRVTRQMVHISRNISGLYISQTACKELGLLTDHFPNPDESTSAAAHDFNSPCQGDCRENEDTTPCPIRTSTPDRPTKIPFAPTKENRKKLEEWLLDAFASSAFNVCTYQTLQGMTGAPMRIVQKPNTQQESPVYSPIPVPFHLKEQVKKDLEGDVRMGVLEKVPQGEVSEWCSRMVITTKTNGKPRRTVDLQDLNKVTLREVHHTPSPINLVASIPKGVLKTVVDARNGFHSLILDEESRKYTKFISEWGSYQYCRGPQGFHGTGDAYTRRFDDITSEEQRYRRCVDDGLLHDSDIENAFWHTFDHIKHCADNGIVFNRDKFRFAEEIVDFAGFEVSMDGYKPSKHTIEAIRDFPTPTNVTDVRAWFGIVNHVAYAFSQGQLMQPFRCLLEKKQPFYWDGKLESLFQASKKEIIKQISTGVCTYDLKKPTCLATDWSKEGLGFSLTQKHCKCTGPADPNCGVGHWKVVFAGSKTTNGAQKRYCPIEGECLAAAYGLERCRMYTLGCPDLTLAVDHKPLTNILNDRQLDTISNPRLRRLKEKTFPFKFKIIYAPGGSNAMKVADALSRHPINNNGEPDNAFKTVEEAAQAYAILQTGGVESVTWRRVNEAAAVDEECVALVCLIVDGFPQIKSMLPTPLQTYWGFKDELYVIESVPFKGHKMLIPKSLRTQVLEGLHAANQGVTGMLANAREHFFWPGLDAAVRQMRIQCRQCNEQAPSQHAEPIVLTSPPDVPFQKTVADLFTLEGHSFLAYADRFSGWLEVERLSSTSFRYVRQTFLRWFSTYGVPEELATDGGPPFNGQEYKQFLKTWDVQKRLSSAHYPQSNGRAEAAVKSAKRILLGNINPTTGALDTDAAARALMTHRNTPTQDTGISPATMLFGRMLRDHLPKGNRKLRPEWDAISKSREHALAKRALKGIEAERKELEPLNIGDAVQIQNQAGNHPYKWHVTGVIAGVLPYRQYQVIVDGSRRVSLRNRRFLRKILPVSRKETDLMPDPQLLPLPSTDDTPNSSPTRPVVIIPADRDTNVDPACRSRTSVPREQNTGIQNLQLPTDQSRRDGLPDIRPDVPPDIRYLENVLVPIPNEGPRRTERLRKPRQLFSANMKGKYHDLINFP